MGTPYQLSAQKREGTGKGPARAARRDGMIPAVIYGGDEPPMNVSLGYREIDRRIHAGGFLTTVATLEVDGQSFRVIPRQFQLDPVRDFPIHVDLLRVTANSRLTLAIPVHFTNEQASPGIKRGGVLNIVRHEVEVTCPVDDIPGAITIDLTGLEIGDSVHISSVKLPEGVRPTISNRDFTIATVAAPAGLKEETPAAEAAPAAAAPAAKKE